MTTIITITILTIREMLTCQKIKGKMLTCALRAHIKNSTNRNYILETVLIYCLKCLILIFFPLNYYH